MALIAAPRLALLRCPHCQVAHPNLTRGAVFQTTSADGHHQRTWSLYTCATCGGVVTTAASGAGADIVEMFPTATTVDDALPERAREYLVQGYESLNAPAGAVMLAACAVDAMLKAKGLTEGSLYHRIDQAAAAHIITEDMSKWAHQVRLDANDQRHADEGAALPTAEDAQRVVDFARALGDFMFVLPSRVTRGLTESGGT